VKTGSPTFTLVNSPTTTPPKTASQAPPPYVATLQTTLAYTTWLAMFGSTAQIFTAPTTTAALSKTQSQIPPAPARESASLKCTGSFKKALGPAKSSLEKITLLVNSTSRKEVPSSATALTASAIAPAPDTIQNHWPPQTTPASAASKANNLLQNTVFFY